jgi:hypothetical protein
MYISNVEEKNDGCIYWVEKDGRKCYGIKFEEAQNCKTNETVENLLLAGALEIDLTKKVI